MLDFFYEHYEILICVAVICIVLFGICIFAKLFRVAIGIAVVAIIVPIVFTIFWGDGSAYVSKFSSFFEPAYQQQIEDAYRYYKEKDAEDPFINYDEVSNTVTDFFHFGD